MPVEVVTARSNQKVTVNALIENPRIIAERIIKVLDNQFAMDQVLRNEGQATGGAVGFRVSSGLFANEPSEIIEEYGEIPVVDTDVGDLNAVPVRDRGLGVVVSQKMRLRNAMGRVDNQITRVRNTLVRDVDGVFVDTLLGAINHTIPASQPWTSSTATIRKNINAARRLIKTNVLAGTTDNFTGYEPDTLLLGPLAEEALLNSDEFLQLIKGSLGPTNISSLAEVPTVLGLKPMVTLAPGLADRAIVCEAKTIGGYADEEPLNASELYEWKPNRLWRSDTVRATAGFIDNPDAACEITGI